MVSLSTISRRFAFFFIDFLKGSPIRKHLSDIRRNMENPKGLNELREKRISDLLSHVIETVPFYESIPQYGKLSDFPVIDKNLIRDNFEQFRSSAYRNKKQFSAVTSGSTGTPFKVFQDGTKKRRNYADTIYFAKLAGFELGYKLIYMKIWPFERMKSALHYRLQNMIPVDVIKLNEPQIDELINRMEKSNQIHGFLGYASAYETMCKILDRRQNVKIKSRVQSIIAISESMNDYTRDRMQHYFNCPAISRYSNLENGILSQQMKNSQKFLINTASYHVEILDLHSNSPVKAGETGRIVITDIYNYAMPFVRYDTGDLGAIETDLETGLHYFSKVEGRKLDQIFDTGGNLVSSYIMYKVMWKYTEIDQYQIIQVSKTEYVMKINAHKFERNEEIITDYKKYLGDDADFKLQFVDEIPMLASGKRQKLVNLYAKSKQDAS